MTASFVKTPAPICPRTSRGSCRASRTRASSRSPSRPEWPHGPCRSSSASSSGTRISSRDRLQDIVRTEHAGRHAIGIFDETSYVKKGDKTPGVKRQWRGAVGKEENCMVTVHLGYACGEFHCLLDGELFLPEDWSADRQRCREAGIPEAISYRPKWQIALELLDRAVGRGIHFEWLTFDEGYGGKPGFLRGLAAPPAVRRRDPPQFHRLAQGSPRGHTTVPSPGTWARASGSAVGCRQSPRSTCRRDAPPARIPGPTLATLAGQGWGERADDLGGQARPVLPQG